MKSQFTKITILLDRSGSMADIIAETLNGLNVFLEDQKKLVGAGTAEISLYSFDTVLETVFEHVPVEKVSPVAIQQVKPRGSTSLNDSLATVIDNLGEHLSKLNENDRPEKVLFVIITDGHENSSHKVTRAQLKEKIEHQSKNYNWQFSYLGANQDAWDEGSSLGISSGSTLTYAANNVGVRSAFDSLNENTREYRSLYGAGVLYAYKQKDVDAQVAAGVTTSAPSNAFDTSAAPVSTT